MLRRLVLLPLLATCGHAAPAPAATDDAALVTAVADEYIARYAEAFPDAADFSAWPEARHDRFPDRSAAAIAAWNGTVDELLAKIERVDDERLFGDPAWITLGYLREALERDRGLRVCRSELWAVDSEGGWQLWIGQLSESQPVGTPEKRDVALKRWATLPRYLEVELANLREGLRLGYSAPKSVVQRVIAQLDGMIALAADQWPIFDPAKRDAELATGFRELIDTKIAPAVRAYRDYLANEYLPAAREALGVSANPDGVACWRASFRAATSIDRDPEETVRLGEARVATFVAEAAAIAKDVLGTDDPTEIAKRLETERANRFASPDEQLAFAKDAVERAHAAMDRVVPTVPTAPVRIEPWPELVGKGASARYESAPEDRSRPATYRINLLQDPTRGESEMVAFHETWPGHHLQIAFAQELPVGHRIKDVVGVASYVEGWARYAEQLSEELGLYTTPYAKIRRRMWPGRGMVVDPGIHLLGWTREQAIAYITAGGWPRDFADGLVDRIAGWPAQLTSYDTGAIEILALRTEAEQRLGERFDLRRFNACVLSAGAVTLPMLRRIVERCL
jgi:uncharacterized protein (DUF885 family)